MRLRRSVKAEIGGSRNLEQKIADVRSKKLVDQNARTRRRTSCQIGGLKSTSIPFSFAASDRHDRPRLSWRPSSSSCGGPQQASGLHRAGHFVQCEKLTLLQIDCRQKLLASLGLAPKYSQHTAGYHCHVRFVHTPRRHAFMGSLDHHADAERFEHAAQAFRNLGRHFFLNLKTLCIDVDKASELRDSNNAIAGKIANMWTRPMIGAI